jgi:hydroxypyruvate isomerase
LPKFAANLTMMFTEHEFLQRFAAAEKAGFKAVEFLFPYDYEAVDIADCLRHHQLENVLFNLPPGDWAAGERGIAALPGREVEFAKKLNQHGITLLIEPINTRDMPGYFLNLQAQAHRLREQCAEPNVQVQMDFYHVQIAEGDLASKLKKYIHAVGHVQIAGVPGRNEPDDGEINYPYLFRLLDELGYDGWVGCEYRPRGITEQGLAWLHAAQLSI